LIFRLRCGELSQPENQRGQARYIPCYEASMPRRPESPWMVSRCISCSAAIIADRVLWPKMTITAHCTAGSRARWIRRRPTCLRADDQPNGI